MRRNQLLLSSFDNVTLKRKLSRFNKLIDVEFAGVEILYAFQDESYNYFYMRFFQIMGDSIYIVFSEPMYIHKGAYGEILRRGDKKKYLIRLGHLIADCHISEDSIDDENEIVEHIKNEHIENKRAHFIDKWKELKEKE